MMNSRINPPGKPWYREPWPWFLMSLPATAVVAGLTTVWIAYRSADGLVVGDYYKAGLAINQTLARDDAARALGLVATLTHDTRAWKITVTGRMPVFPDRLRLTLAHPTRQGRDQILVLAHAGGGRYHATASPTRAGKWHAELVDADATWRLSGTLHTPLRAPVTLGASSVPPDAAQGG